MLKLNILGNIHSLADLIYPYLALRLFNIFQCSSELIVKVLLLIKTRMWEIHVCLTLKLSNSVIYSAINVKTSTTFMSRINLMLI